MGGLGNCQRGEGDVGFLVSVCLANKTEFISVKYNENVWDESALRERKVSLVHRMIVSVLLFWRVVTISSTKMYWALERKVQRGEELAEH